MASCRRCGDDLTDANWSPSAHSKGERICRGCNAIRCRDYGRRNAQRERLRHAAYREAHIERYRALRKASYARDGERQRSQARAWRLVHPDQVRRARARRDLRVLYGLDEASYASLVAAQAGACAICGSPLDILTNDRTKRAQVDHDHGTHAVRGILCPSCNKGLGFFRESPAFLVEAARYLDDHC